MYHINSIIHNSILSNCSCLRHLIQSTDSEFLVSVDLIEVGLFLYTLVFRRALFPLENKAISADLD